MEETLKAARFIHRFIVGVCIAFTAALVSFESDASAEIKRGVGEPPGELSAGAADRYEAIMARVVGNEVWNSGKATVATLSMPLSIAGWVWCLSGTLMMGMFIGHMSQAMDRIKLAPSDSARNTLIDEAKWFPWAMLYRARGHAVSMWLVVGVLPLIPTVYWCVLNARYALSPHVFSLTVLASMCVATASVMALGRTTELRRVVHEGER